MSHDREELETIKDEAGYACRKVSKSSRRRTVDKGLKKIIAPFCSVVRRGTRRKEDDTSTEVSEFQVFLSSVIDFTTLLNDTADVLKTSTQSTGVLVYLVDHMKNEIYLKPQYMTNVERHKVNWPICEGQTIAGHAAATKRFVMIEDAATETRFSEGLVWQDAKTAFCLPVIQPDNTCYAVLELYRTNEDEPYSEDQLRVAQCCAGWMGAAVHQANKRISLEQKTHLSKELLSLLVQYFSDQVGLDKMIFDILSISKKCLKATRGTFYIIDPECVVEDMMADMYDEGWENKEGTTLKKKTKVSLAHKDTPQGLTACTGQPVNVKDLYNDDNFHKEVDPISGTIVRSVLCMPIRDKNSIIGVICAMNKHNEAFFTEDDKESFGIIANYCRQIVQYSNSQQKNIASKNLNLVYAKLLERHMTASQHDLEVLMQNRVTLLPTKFEEFEWYIQSDIQDRVPELLFYMINRLSGSVQFDRYILSEFILSVLDGYRDNPYHNAEHAFTFTHTMYNILLRNMEEFNTIEVIALMIGGFCHDIDHPGLNNSFLIESKHPLSAMYSDSILENYHYFLTQKMILDKGLLQDLTPEEIQRALEEIRFNIICTDLAVHFRIRAQLAPIVAEKSFDWDDLQHRKLIKSVMMTSCDLAVQAKPFHVVKKISEKLYEEFYNQGDLERKMGYTPLSMMDRNKSINQATEQIQFLHIVVHPCLLLLKAILKGTNEMTDFCLKAKDSWQELNELREKKLWQLTDSYARSATTVTIKSDSVSNIESEEFSFADKILEEGN